MSRPLKKTRDPMMVGFSASLAGHLFLGLLLIISGYHRLGEFEDPVVYSISLEGGKSLGGMSQVPKKSDTQKAPPKNVKAPEKKVEKKAEVKVEKKVEPKKEEPKKEEAEVSLKEKATPVPVKKEEAKKQATPAPKATAPPKPEDVNKKLQEAMQRYLGESSAGTGQGFGAARLGGQGMGGGVQRPPEFFYYLEQLKAHVTEGWRWYDTNAPIQAVVTFDIAPDGRISGIILYRSSGNTEFDNSALRAVARANPAPAPPASVYEFFRKTRVIFDPRDQAL